MPALCRSDQIEQCAPKAYDGGIRRIEDFRALSCDDKAMISQPPTFELKGRYTVSLWTL